MENPNLPALLPAAHGIGRPPLKLNIETLAAQIISLSGNISAVARVFGAHRHTIQARIDKHKGLKKLHFHISGIDYGPKGEKAHLPLNEADIRYRELLQAFIDYGVQATAAIEAPLPFHTADALTFQATYRRLIDLKYGDGKLEEEAD